MSLAVWEQGGMLMIQTPGFGLRRLVHQGVGSFVMAEDLSYEVVFRLDDRAGRHLIVRRFGKTIAIGRRLQGRNRKPAPTC
jgi:hypothetical protein